MFVSFLPIDINKGRGLMSMYYCMDYKLVNKISKRGGLQAVRMAHISQLLLCIGNADQIPTASGLKRRSVELKKRGSWRRNEKQ
jgi:hypothetical protein